MNRIDSGDLSRGGVGTRSPNFNPMMKSLNSFSEKKHKKAKTKTIIKKLPQYNNNNKSEKYKKNNKNNYNRHKRQSKSLHHYSKNNTVK